MRSRLHEVARIRLTQAEMSTASDHVQSAAPKGTVTVSPRMLAAARQHDEGISLGELAKLYGVARTTVSKWCTLVSEAQADERHLRLTNER